MSIKVKITQIAIMLLLPVSSLWGQTGEGLLSIEDCFNGKLNPKRLSGIQWIPNSSKFSRYYRGGIIVTDVFTKKEDTLITTVLLNSKLNELNDTLAGLPAITWKDESNFWFVNKGNLYTMSRIDLVPTLLRQFDADFQAIEVHPKSLNVAIVSGDNIKVNAYGTSAKVTTDGSKDIVYGQSVHRDEFGISKGLFWSPSGNKLAFYRMDQTRVTDYPIYNLDERPAAERKIKYPMAGDSSHTVTLGVYNTQNNETLYLQIEGSYDQYVTNVTWSPDDEFIFIAWVNRDQNRMELRKYKSESGELAGVEFVEQHEKYVEPEHGPIFLPNSNKDYLWFSERSGYNHLYLVKNKKITPLTTGSWVVTEFLGFSDDGTVIYFEATKESPLERHLYALSFLKPNAEIKRLTLGRGTHKTILNLNREFYIDAFTSSKEPMKYTAYKFDGTNINEIFKSPNPLENYKLGEMRIEPVLLNKIPFYTRTFFPPDFDPTKKYPVVVYLYGGPHLQLITESWLGGANLWFHYMAQHGYIVYSVDSRGSSNRGLEFENAVHRQLGTVEMQDQLAALDYLKKNPWVDSTRIGVHGWSFGGFLTTSLMTRAPGVYKVGVAGGPVIDWKYYEIMYTERYMDKPQQNPEGYKEANLLNYANQLKGKLLMIHGTSDDVVVWQHSLLYVKKNVEVSNANLDYFVYPGHPHNVLGADRIHLYKKVSNYFFDFL